MELQSGFLILAMLRILIPLSIFRWPLWGGIASLLLDAVDCQITAFLASCIPDYILTDKYFDLYYLTIELIVSRRWINDLAKKAALYLYLWRVPGVVVFHLTGSEKWLVLTPNVFEYFFLFFAALQFFKIETPGKKWLKSGKKLVPVLVVLFLLKIPQEVLLHLWKEPLYNFYRWFNSLL